MLAIGHFALGYLTGKAASKLAKVKINLPLLLAISVIPDVDLLIGFMDHRGLTHSIIVVGAFAAVFFAKYKKAILPYLAALLSHIFLGDLISGGIEFLWPLYKTRIGFGLDVRSLPVSLIELSLFFVSIVLMYKQGDLQTLFKPNNHNLLLVLCIGATLGSFSPMLLLPDLIWITIFVYSVTIETKTKFSAFKTKIVKSV